MASTNTTPQRAAPPVKPFDELACLRVRSEMLFWKLDPARSTVDDSAVAAATEQPPAASLSKRKFGSMRALSANSNKRRRHSTLRDATNSADAASNFEAPAPRLKLKTTPLSVRARSQPLACALCPLTHTARLAAFARRWPRRALEPSPSSAADATLTRNPSAAQDDRARVPLAVLAALLPGQCCVAHLSLGARAQAADVARCRQAAD